MLHNTRAAIHCIESHYSKKWQNFKTWNPVTLEVSMGIYVPCESADHLRVRCFAVLRSALLCASTLCYAESNDHWSLRVCPIPNLNLIPVVRLLARPALVMTLDWLLWAAHHHLHWRCARSAASLFTRRGWTESGFARGGAEEEARGGAGPAAYCASRRRPICMRADQQHCTKGLEGAPEWLDIQTQVASGCFP